jgi:hypothetical protein
MQDRISLEVVERDHAVDCPAFDFTLFVKARISVVLVSTPEVSK